MTQLPTYPDSFKTLSPVLAITHDVARRHGISPQDIHGDCKRQKIFEAKAEAFYLAFVATRHSICELGRLFHKDHTSILNGIAYYCAKHKMPVPRRAQWARYDWWVQRLASKPPPPWRPTLFKPVKPKIQPRPRSKPTWETQLAKEVRQSFGPQP